MGHYESLWVILVHYGSFWLIPPVTKALLADTFDKILLSWILLSSLIVQMTYLKSIFLP